MADIQIKETTIRIVFMGVLNCFGLEMLLMTHALSTVMAVRDQMAAKPDTTPITP